MCHVSPANFVSYFRQGCKYVESTRGYIEGTITHTHQQTHTRTSQHIDSDTNSLMHFSSSDIFRDCRYFSFSIDSSLLKRINAGINKTNQKRLILHLYSNNYKLYRSIEKIYSQKKVIGETKIPKKIITKAIL